MTVTYSVEVDDQTAAKLDNIRDNEIEEALLTALEILAEKDDEIEERQDELHDRMNVKPSGDQEDEELSPEDAAEAYREKIRRDRTEGGARRQS